MALYNAMGLAAFVLGINAVVNNLPKSDYPVLFIVSLALGSLLGTILNLEGGFRGLMGRFSKSDLAEGLSTGILLFCVGTLSMVGQVMSALYGDNTYLFANATLDLVTSAVLASTYGIGMVLAAPVSLDFPMMTWAPSSMVIVAPSGTMSPPGMYRIVSLTMVHSSTTLRIWVAEYVLDELANPLTSWMYMAAVMLSVCATMDIHLMEFRVLNKK